MAAEQRHRESAERAAETAEKALATEQRRRESAECAAATAEKALVKEQRLSSSAKMALVEYEPLPPSRTFDFTPQKIGVAWNLLIAVA